MKLLFLDDSKQKSSARERMGPPLGVGGVVVDSTKVRKLEDELEAFLNKSYGMPRDEVFKWSPAKDHWLRNNVKGADRTNLFNGVLNICRTYESKFIAAIVDTTKGHATAANGHETDALFLCLERFDTMMSAEEYGLVLLAKPSGGVKDENKMLSECVEMVGAGTGFVEFKKLSLNVVTVPFNHSRILQCADLVVSVTTAMMANQTAYAAHVFEEVKAGLHQNFRGQIGGAGVKIHPSTLTNLYHWVLGDDYYVKGGGGVPLPNDSFFFTENSTTR